MLSIYSLSLSPLSRCTECIDDPRSTRAIEEEQIIYECINLHDVEETEQDQKEPHDINAA